MREGWKKRGSIPHTHISYTNKGETMGSRQHKVLRKANKVDRDELTVKYNREYGKLVTERDEALAKVNEEYRGAIATATDQKNRDRKKINEEFEQARKKMTKEVVNGNVS